MPIKDAQRRGNGLRRLTVWLRPEVIRQLDAICEENGWSRAEILSDMITGESEEAAKASKAARGIGRALP